MVTWLRYLIAIVVAFHGFIYIPYGLAAISKIKEWKGSSWILGNIISGERLMSIVKPLHLITGIVTISCAIAIGFASDLWRPLAIAAGIFGIAAFASFWDGQEQQVVPEGGIGAFISLFLILSVVVFPQAFR